MQNNFSWILLVLAGILECVWGYFLKESHGLSRVIPTVFFVINLVFSMFLLALSLKSIPMSVAYPIWTGIGAVGSILIGYFLFQEPMGLMRIFFLSLIVIGILGIKAFA